MRWMKRFLIVLILAAVAVAAVKVVQVRRQEQNSVQAPKRPLVRVQTARVRTGTLEVTRTYRGILRPERTVAITPRIQGRIESVQGEAGDTVQAGEILVKIDAAEITHQIRALQAERKRLRSRVDLWTKTYNRQQVLVQRGNLSRDTFDRTASSLDQARAESARIEQELQQARVQLGYTRLSAPGEGRIQGRLQEPGDMARPGKPILVLEDPSAGYNVHVQVPARIRARMHSGQEMVLFNRGRRKTVTIDRLHPAVAGGSPLVEVEAHLTDRPFGLPSGASIRTRIRMAKPTGLVVPVQTVLEQKGGAWVFRLDAQKRVHPVRITITARTDHLLAVQGRLQEDDVLVRGPFSLLMRLHPGQQVETAKEGGP